MCRARITLGLKHDQPIHADFAAVSGFIFVALGAFGAHVLSKSLGVVEMGWIRPALNTGRSIRWLFWAGGSDAAPHQHLVLLEQRFPALGTVLFSGSLYCLALSHLRLWAFVTPVGGVSFGRVGIMFIGAIRLKRKGVVHE